MKMPDAERVLEEFFERMFISDRRQAERRYKLVSRGRQILTAAAEDFHTILAGAVGVPDFVADALKPGSAGVVKVFIFHQSGYC